MTNNTFLFLGNASYFNKGCEGIVRGTTEILDKYFLCPYYVNETIYYDYNEYQYIPKYELNNRLINIGFDFTQVIPKRKNLINLLLKKQLFCNHISLVKYLHKNVLEYLNTCKAALAIGGDNYSLDYSIPTRHLDLSNLVNAYKKPLILWGASVGPFSSNPEFERYMTKHLEKFDIIFSREDLTSNYLFDLGISSDKIHRVSDPAYVMRPLRPEDFDRRPEFKILHDAIGINLAGIIGQYWYDGDHKTWTEYCIQLINRIKKRFDRPVFLIPHVCHDLPFNNDYKFMLSIMQHIENKENVFLIDPRYNAQELKYLISRLYCFIGSRLHSTIAAFSSEIPTLSISYSMKSQGISKEVYGHTNFCLTKESHEKDLFLDLLAFIIDNREKIHNMQKLKIDKIKKNAYRAGKILKHFLQ